MDVATVAGNYIKKLQNRCEFFGIFSAVSVFY